MKKYQINEKLVLREEDNALLNSKELHMITYNETGFLIIHHLIKNKNLTYDELKQFAIELKLVR